MGSLTFLYRIQRSITFILSIFGYIAYVWQRPSLKGIYFADFAFLCLHVLPVLKMTAIGFSSTQELLMYV